MLDGDSHFIGRLFPGWRFELSGSFGDSLGILWGKGEGLPRVFSHRIIHFELSKTVSES